jgi:hypothetical protein
MIYYSQLGQDKFIDDFFSSKENGIFLDIGAHDGESGSNTYFLEKFIKVSRLEITFTLGIW